MAPQLAILPATLADLPAIADLAALSWRAAYPSIIPTEQIDYMLNWMYSIPQLRQDLADGVAFDRLLRDAQLVGFAAYGPAADPGECKLHKLYLHPDHQRRGLGTRLLDHVRAAAGARGFRVLILNVNKRNTSAIAAYRKNGFIIREEVVNPIGQGFVMDDYVMACPLRRTLEKGTPDNSAGS